MSVDILLATYNGECFLEEQLQSILSQDYFDWRLLIRDDGSSDRTHKIIQVYRQQESHRFQSLNSGEHRNLGIVQNFNHLLEQSCSDYTFLCDQDDVWLPHKLTESLKVIQLLESKWGGKMPILVHSDLQVVNDQLGLLHSSFWHSHNLDPTLNSLKHLLIRNHITGCTVVINKALREIALPIPKAAFMHDWWLGLVATAFGKIAHINQPTVLYRQHQCNQVGAPKQKFRYFARQLRNPQRMRNYYRKTQIQARGFLRLYQNRLTDTQRKIVTIISNEENLTFFHKRQLMIQYGLFDQGLARNIALLSLI